MDLAIGKTKVVGTGVRGSLGAVGHWVAASIRTIVAKVPDRTRPAQEVVEQPQELEVVGMLTEFGAAFQTTFRPVKGNRR